MLLIDSREKIEGVVLVGSTVNMLSQMDMSTLTRTRPNDSQQYILKKLLLLNQGIMFPAFGDDVDIQPTVTYTGWLPTGNCKDIGQHDTAGLQFVMKLYT